MSDRHRHCQVPRIGHGNWIGLRGSGVGVRPLWAALAAMLALNPGVLWACVACSGQSDSAMAKGMNWGIMSLLVMVAVVLGGVTSFFVYLAKKSASMSAATVAKPAAESGDMNRE